VMEEEAMEAVGRAVVVMAVAAMGEEEKGGVETEVEERVAEATAEEVMEVVETEGAEMEVASPVGEEKVAEGMEVEGTVEEETVEAGMAAAVTAAAAMAAAAPEVVAMAEVAMEAAVRVEAVKVEEGTAVGLAEVAAMSGAERVPTVEGAEVSRVLERRGEGQEVMDSIDCRNQRNLCPTNTKNALSQDLHRRRLYHLQTRSRCCHKRERAAVVLEMVVVHVVGKVITGWVERVEMGVVVTAEEAKGAAAVVAVMVEGGLVKGRGLGEGGRGVEEMGAEAKVVVVMAEEGSVAAEMGAVESEVEATVVVGLEAVGWVVVV